MILKGVFRARFKRDSIANILLAVILTGSLVTLMTFILVRDVTIYDGEEISRLHTFSHRVEDVLKEAGIELNARDEVQPSLDSKLSRVCHITITRSYPVYLKVDGQLVEYRSTGETAGEILQKCGIKLSEQDLLNCSPDEPVEPGGRILVTRVFTQQVTEEVVLSYRTVIKENGSMDRGISRIVQPGRNGLKEDLIEITYKDGLEREKTVLNSRIVSPRQDKVVEQGTNTLLAARGGITLRFSRAMYVTATAYCSGVEGTGCPIDEKGRSACTGKNNNGYTSSGIKAVAGTGERSSPHIIAVDPRIIPLGSEVYIEKYGYALAADVGSSIKKNRIDILMSTHQQALNFGRRKLKIYLL